MKCYRIYTDGACHVKRRVGGYAFLVIKPDNMCDIESARVEDTTNNRMELQPVIQALAHIQALPRYPTTIFSDSEYVVKGVNEYMEGWKEKGWHKVKNPELWQLLDTQLQENSNVELAWVRGHDKNPLNNFVDMLAVSASDGIVMSTSGSLMVVESLASM